MPSKVHVCYNNAFTTSLLSCHEIVDAIILTMLLMTMMMTMMMMTNDDDDD